MYLNYQSIELDKYIAKISESATFNLTIEAFSKLVPSTNPLWIKRELTATDEAFALLIRYGDLPMDGIADLREVIKRLEKQMTLSGIELFQITQQRDLIVKIQSYVMNCEYSVKVIDEYFSALTLQRKTNQVIKDKVLPSGQLNEQNIPVLRNLSMKIREMEIEKQQGLKKFITDHRDVLVDEIISQRHDRSCLLVKNTYKNSIRGYIHGESASGQAVYLEPGFLVKLNNESAELQAQYDLEVLKILRELSEAVLPYAGELRYNLETLVILDQLFTKARFMKRYEGINAVLSDNRVIDFKVARHPLISEKRVVSNSYYLSSDKPMLLISGPNTGGKTVSLKLLGLFTLATYTGLPILCENAEVGIFSNVFIDIGDQQSIENSLSTFSSHLKTLSTILHHADENSLVILDELGSGTDPKEGASFAMAILDHLQQRHAFTVATTHFARLKEYAYSHDSVKIAAMELDQTNLVPTYRVLEGASGNSYALEIASKFDILPEVIQKAHYYVAQDTSEVDVLINRLNQQRINLEQQQEELYEQLVEVERLKEQLTNQTLQLEEKKSEILAVAQQEAQLLVEETLEAATGIIEELKAKEAIKPHEALKAKQELSVLIPNTSIVRSSYQPKLGDYVQIKSSGQTGIVISIRKQEVVVDVNGIKMKTNPGQLISSTPVKIKSKKTQQSLNLTKGSMSLSINLVGLRVDEAIDMLSKYLDDCLMMHAHQITVIHGVGTGALRKAVSDYLKSVPFVSSSRLGNGYEGGVGVTVVELKVN